MATRSTTLNVAAAGDATTLSDLVALDKENVNPLTGERAGSLTTASKKRKTSVLATKVQPPPATKVKKDSDTQPEPKKRKGSTAATTKPKGSKKDTKVTGSGRKPSTKRAGSRKISPMPKLEEETEKEKERLSQAEIDSRCYDLTVKPLADVSEAYEQVDVFNGLPSSSSGVSETRAKFRTVKASSAEPEIRDYFAEPSQALFSSSTTSRRRAMSEDIAEPRAFSTPERKQIYAAFTFSSPSGSSTRLSKASGSGDASPAKQLA
ncbi:hypothetical protein NLJ89_g11349 [Agrocybe chaxingu]|uniref:Uncharacterized protein n=1 Tax=Agrocybe chaxingu TaxID=84603 RepID=A0A9W8MRQ1_9AGAR|nr:hypothetical protein NLJ89_g11349 [Agrocybe chaxingu]